MKHHLIAFSLIFGMLFLSCDDTNESLLANAITADSIGSEIDSIVTDSAYIPSDSLWVVDSIYFPADSIIAPGDTIVIDSINFNP